MAAKPRCCNHLAKYGFLRMGNPIECYNWKMDKSRARELNPKIIEHFKSLLAGNRYDSVMINLGKDCLPAILGHESILPKETHLTFAQGRIGPRQKQMREWILSVSK